MRRSIASLSGCLVCLVALAGCGLKGPLVLPDAAQKAREDKKKNAPASVPAPPPAPQPAPPVVPPAPDS
jgi:predicted small lipoprotein YifL